MFSGFKLRFNFEKNLVLLESSQWKVPVAVCTSASPTEPVIETLLEKDSCTVVVTGVGKDQWIKVHCKVLSVL